MEPRQSFFSKALFEDVCGWQGPSRKGRGCLATGRDHSDKDHHGARSLRVPVGAGVFPLRSSQTLLDLGRRGAKARAVREKQWGRLERQKLWARAEPFPTASQRFKKKKKKENK